MKIDRNTLFGTAFLFSFALLSLSLFDVYSSLSLIENNTNHINLNPVTETQVLGTTVDSINETGRVLGLNGCNWLPINAVGVTTQDAPPNQEWWSDPSGGYNDPIIHQAHSLGARNVYFATPKKFDEILIWDNECSDAGGTNCQNGFYGTGKLFLNNIEIYSFVLPTMANEQWRTHQLNSEIIADRFEYTPATRNSGTIDSGGYNFCVRNAPIGYLDSVQNSTCSAHGWACDNNRSSQPLTIHFYSGANMIGSVVADRTRSGLGTYCGGYEAHDFWYNLPENFKDGTSREVRAYALGINPDGSANSINPQLIGSPKNITCSVTPINGTCGSANGKTYDYSVTSYGTDTQCSNGSPSSTTFPSLGSSTSWTCSGQNGGNASSSCSASRNSAPINGSCGTANNTYVSSAPSANLCNTGTATSVSGTGPWTWSCEGSGNGTTVSCSANISINGTCGTAARTYLFSEKAYVGLYCSAGTVTPLFPAFPQPGELTTWTCNGIGTGSTNTTCTADVLSDEDQSCQNTDSAIFLEGTIRDFNDTHIDFENRRISGLKTGIVENLLDSEKKPVYTGINTNGSINGIDSFRQWYRDVPGVNQSMPFTIRLERVGSSTIFRYLSNQFFPIDNQLLGNQGRNHNFHFTFESQTSFLYQGGETFNFTGDDDIWLFVDGKLAMDLGGTHSPASQTVNMDSLGLTRGKIYTMNFFFAERHTTGSNFSIETDIKMANPVCINVDCTIDPTHPSCNFCLNPGQGNINQDSTTCSNPTRPKIKITDENSIGDKVTGIDASQDLKLDWTDTLPVQNSQCFASYNFELKKADNDTVVMTKRLVDLSEILIPESNLDYGTNYKWKVTGNAIQSENKNISLTYSDLTAADCAQTVVPYTITKTFDIPEYSRINSGTISIPTSNAISSISINGDVYNAPISSQDILTSIKEGTNTVIITISSPASCGT